MSGITALGTTYNLPNYTGILHQLTPSDTPFFSAIGGLTGGGQCTSTQFEWGTFDLRAAGQNVALEGQDAPTEQERVRGSVNNVTQIHQETVGVSYTKLAAVGQKAGLNNEATNPVRSELDWQVEQMLKQMVRDVEWSLLRGAYQLPVDNTTARKTRGLITAITTNVVDGSTVLTNTGAAVATTDVITSNAHGMSDGDQVNFTSVGTATPLTVNTVYYVVASTTNTYKVSTTKGGTAVDITADGTVTARKRTAANKTLINSTLQTVWEAGGIMESDTATLIVGSSQKLAITNAYLPSGNYAEQSRNLAGVNVTMIETDFGRLNIMLDRHAPADTITVCSLEQCRPVFLEIPGKGHFFAEELAKTGAKDRTMLYGEVGLEYGNELAHGKITNLAV